MKKIIETSFLGIILLALGMNIPSQAYYTQEFMDHCRGCWSFCLSPLPIGQQKDCSYCNEFCDTSKISCSDC